MLLALHGSSGRTRWRGRGNPSYRIEAALQEAPALTAPRGWRVFAILLVGALAAAALASGQLAAWADANADRPGGETLAVVLHAWNDLLAPLDGARAWLHVRARAAAERQF